ncbi:MAG: trypsin-like peptidase domain-containing protein [Lachnospiraceae bacterium]|nr:trypsin-like peptidase domain-containing protein [Lachnospiraceae bacterium]
MANKGWNGKKHAAACLGSGMMLAALALAQNYPEAPVWAAENGTEEERVSLSVAGETEAETGAMETAAQENIELTIAGADTAEVRTVSDTAEEQTGEAETETAAEEPETEEAAEDGETEETQAVKAEDRSAVTLETTATGEDGIVAMDVSGIVENCMPSIVSITNNSVQEVESYFYGKQEIEQSSAASGIIVAQSSTELMIATNKHVVEDADELTVCFTVDVEDPEDAVVPALTKGTDADYDLAVVAVKLSDIPEDVLNQIKIATLGSSENLKVGETAIAIGNALGTGQTVTCGIISALEREVTTSAGTFTELQTDAAINLGCSGGALLNRRGEVIGINSAKATADYAESMGYAIPIDEAIPVLTELINCETKEKVENHGYMGITVVPVSEEAMQMYNMPAGAFVYSVQEGSAGEAAGLKKGDIITKLDDISVDSSDSLVDALNYYAVGETVTVELQEAVDGSYVSREVEVTLQEGTKEAEDEEAEDDRAGETEGEEEEVPYEYEFPFPFDGNGDSPDGLFDGFFGGWGGSSEHGNSGL